MSGAAFLLQVLGTPALLGRFGIKAGLRMLPAGFLVGAAALLLAGGVPDVALIAAAVAVLCSDGLRFSVDKASVELLYLPIPRAVKDQAKPFVDTAVDRLAGATSALLWLLLTWAFHIDRPERICYASLVTLGVVGTWLLVIRRARRAYLDAYRRMLSPLAQVREEGHPHLRHCRELLKGVLALPAEARTRALRSITRFHRAEPRLRLAIEDIAPHLKRETATLRLLTRALAGEGVEPLLPRERSRPLLVRVLEEKLDHSVERIGRLLALVYPPHDILAADRAIRRGTAAERACGLELIDNLIEGGAKGDLMRALDEACATGVRRADRAGTIAALMQSDDSWLRACAAFTIRREDEDADDHRSRAVSHAGPGHL